jgi:hypothetical protein
LKWELQQLSCRMAALPKKAGKPLNNWAEGRLFGQTSGLWGIFLICLLLISTVICGASPTAVYRIWPARVTPETEFHPVLVVKNVFVADDTVHSYPGVGVVEFGLFGYGEGVVLSIIGPPSGPMPFSDVGHFLGRIGYQVANNHSHAQDVVRFIMGKLAVWNHFDIKIPHYAGRWSLAAIGHDQGGGWCDTDGKRIETVSLLLNSYPRALVYPHRIKLAAHDYELVDACSSKRQGEGGYAPIRECLLSIRPRLEAFPPRWVLIPLGIACSLCGGSCCIVGCFFLFHDDCIRGAALCFLLCVLFFCLYLPLAI